MSGESATSAGPEDWRAVAHTPFVALTTYRRTGLPVTTPVWIAEVGQHLVVTTEATAGKVKRLRNDRRVQLQPCSRFGRVDAGAPLVRGYGVIAGPDGDHRDAIEALFRKYGWQYRLVLALERAIRRLQRNDSARVIVRIFREDVS